MIGREMIMKMMYETNAAVVVPVDAESVFGIRSSRFGQIAWRQT